MKKKKHHRPKGRRNDSGGSAAIARRSRAPRAEPTPKRAAPPWRSIVTAVASGLGSAAIGGLIAYEGILSHEAVGIGLMLGGAAAAYFAEDNARLAGLTIAGVGAGEFAIAQVTKRLTKVKPKTDKDPAADAGGAANQNAAQPAAPAQPQLPAPPPPSTTPRASASGGGVVLDLFRQASNDLDTIDDAWRYGMHDGPGGPVADPYEPIVIDLDQAA